MKLLFDRLPEPYRSEYGIINESLRRGDFVATALGCKALLCKLAADMGTMLDLPFADCITRLAKQYSAPKGLAFIIGLTEDALQVDRGKPVTDEFARDLHFYTQAVLMKRFIYPAGS